MDDFDVKHHDRELDDLLSEVKGLLGEEPEEDECPDESDAPDTPQEPEPPPSQAVEAQPKTLIFLLSAANGRGLSLFWTRTVPSASTSAASASALTLVSAISASE